MSEDDDMRDFLAQSVSKCDEESIPDPFSGAIKKDKKYTSFTSMNLNSGILNAIRKKGYTNPTPIQRKVIPLILSGKDVIAMARTGSGKTLAFVIPILQRLQSHETSGIRAVILSPTQELSQQTYKYVKKLSHGSTLRVALVIGGDSIESQFESLSSGPDIVIASPGRLLHLIHETGLSLKALEVLVFDEGDRLLEMGFKNEIEAIISQTNSNKQTLIFSATLPAELNEFAQAGLKDPAYARLDAEKILSRNLYLAFFSVRPEEKPAALVILLNQISKPTDQIIIFVATRYNAEYLNMILQHLNFTSVIAHGTMDSAARKINMAKFIKKKSQILIVTDIAARGIDIPNLDIVINYDFPDSTKLFIHRVGRTARGGCSGSALSLLEPDEYPYLLDLKMYLMGTDVPTEIDNRRNMIHGIFPQFYLESQQEIVSGVINKLDNEMDKLKKSMLNGLKRYKDSRADPSLVSIKRAKDMLDENGENNFEIHPMVSHLTDEKEKELENFMKTQIRCYRPQHTIFEYDALFTGKKDILVDLMNKKRFLHQPRILEIRKQKLEKKERSDEQQAINSTVGEKDDGNIELKTNSYDNYKNNDNFDDLSITENSENIKRIGSEYNESNSENFTPKDTENLLAVPKSKKIKRDWRDENYFMGNKTSIERQVLAIKDHKNETVEDILFEIAPDDEKSILKKKQKQVWRRRGRRFTNEEDTAAGRKKMKIKNEAGKLVIGNDKNRGKAYNEWVKRTQKHIPLPGETPSDDKNIEYNFYRHVKNGIKRAQLNGNKGKKVTIKNEVVNRPKLEQNIKKLNEKSKKASKMRIRTRLNKRKRQ